MLPRNPPPPDRPGGYWDIGPVNSMNGTTIWHWKKGPRPGPPVPHVSIATGHHTSVGVPNQDAARKIDSTYGPMGTHSFLKNPA